MRDAIRRGRAEWLAPFLSLSEEEALREAGSDNPQSSPTCKLDFSERGPAGFTVPY